MQINKYYQKKVYTVGNHRKQAILKLIDKENPRVLDIGCGDGELGAYIIQKKGGTVDGVDISESALEEAQNVLNNTFCFNVENDPWPTELVETTYDYIIISEVLEHLFYPEQLIRTLRNNTHTDTAFIITVPNVLFWINRIKMALGKFEYSDSGLMDRGHIHFFTWKSFTHMLDQCGLEILENLNKVPTRGTKFLGRMFPGLFAYQFVVKAILKKDQPTTS